MSFKVRVNIAEALAKAKRTNTELDQAVEAEVEKAALRTVNDAATNAPRRDGHLKNSITSSPKRIKAYTWRVGSDRPYAARQEYEHKTNRGFFRKALFNERTRFRDALAKLLEKVGR